MINLYITATQLNYTTTQEIDCDENIRLLVNNAEHPNIVDQDAIFVEVNSNEGNIRTNINVSFKAVIFIPAKVKFLPIKEC